MESILSYFIITPLFYTRPNPTGFRTPSQLVPSAPSEEGARALVPLGRSDRTLTPPTIGIRWPSPQDGPAAPTTREHCSISLLTGAPPRLLLAGNHPQRQAANRFLDGTAALSQPQSTSTRQVFHRAIEPFLFHDARCEATGRWRAGAGAAGSAGSGCPRCPSSAIRRPRCEAVAQARYAKRARRRRPQPWRAINSSSQAAECGQQPSQADAERRGCWHRQWRALARSGRRRARLSRIRWRRLANGGRRLASEVASALASSRAGSRGGSAAADTAALAGARAEGRAQPLRG